MLVISKFFLETVYYNCILGLADKMIASCENSLIHLNCFLDSMVLLGKRVAFSFHADSIDLHYRPIPVITSCGPVKTALTYKISRPTLKIVSIYCSKLIIETLGS
jgi:hypothetical protein